MGVRTRTIRQSITELVCDYCKKDITEDDARIGMLSLRAPGQRGRPAQVDVAFHTGCAGKITDSASKPKRTRSSSPAGNTRTKSAARKLASRKPAGGKPATKKRAAATKKPRRRASQSRRSSG